MSNSSSANEVLLWPPPPETFEGTSDESTLFNHNNTNDELANTTPTFDLFACIHTPGAEDDDVQVAPGGGLLEIHPSKVVFDNSSALYPSCTREVQKRIVSDLQRAYARTSQGRELAVKEWADGSQNRGILRLRLRCKKAKCRLQFQVNWETQLKHWFITRQCQNLVHTCPLPKPKSNSGNGNTSTNGGHKRKTSSLNGKNGTTKNVVEPPNEETSHTDLSAVVDMNGIHHHHHRRDDSYYSGTVTPEAATSSAEWNDMVVCGNDNTGNGNHNPNNYNHHHDAIVPPPPPITSYNVVSNHHHSHHHPHNHSPYHDTTSYSTTNQDAGTSALAPAPSSMPHASVLSTVHHDAPAPPEVAVSSSEYYVPPAAPVPHVVVTDADRAEAELLATDLRQWIPPPTTTTHGEMPPPLATTAITTSTAILGSSNNNSHPSQQDHLGVSASSPPLTLSLPLTTNAPAAAAATTLVPQQHVDPSFASVVTMPPQQHLHQLYDENHESLMPPPPMQSLSILNEIHYSMQQQQQQQQQLPPESAPAPHHVPSSFTAQPPAATIQIPTTISTITENHQHQHQHRYHPHHPVAPPSPMTPSRYLSGEFDSTEAAGMSIGANSTAMSIEQPNTPGGGGRGGGDGDYNEEGGEEKRGPSSGLYPHGETDGMSVLSESESNMMTLGSVSSKYWMNSLPNIPHANFSRLTSDNYNSIGSWFVDNKSSIGRRQTSQSNMPNTNNSNHTNNGGATGSAVYNNNFSINDLTMASLTDSVRNMLSIMEGGGTLIGTSGLMPTVGEIALDSDVVFGQVFSPTDVGSHEGGEVHAPSSSSSAQDPQQQQHHNHQPQQVQLYQQHPISHAQQQRPRPPPGPPPPRQGILAADFYTPPPNIGSPSQTHSVVAHHRPSASLS